MFQSSHVSVSCETVDEVGNKPGAEYRKEVMATKQIPVSELTIGMYVVGLDRPWPQDSALRDRHRIARVEDIALLEVNGVRHATIDPTLGEDVTASPLTPKQPPTPDAPPTPGSGPLGHELERARAVRAEAMATVESIFEGVKTGAPINVEAVKQTVRTLIDSVLHNDDALICLNHIQQFDADLFTHAVDVCVFALVIGKQQGFRTSQLERLGLGALLHDVGQMRLPHNLLQKQGAFTEQERQLMHQHPRLGAAILMQVDGIPEESLRIVVEHHERLNGAGYPAGLKGVDISPLSEITSIADVYDAMLSSQQGLPPLLPAQAIRELYQCGIRGEFDPRWVERVVRCFGIYPVGSLVELSTGERGVVTAVSHVDALRPSVNIIWDASRQRYPTPLCISLAAPNIRAPERTIVRTLDPVQENLDIQSYYEESGYTR